MSFALRSKKLRRLIAVLIAAFFIAVTGFLTVFGPFGKLDYQVLDGFYKQAVKRGRGPDMSPQIVYLVIDDETYDFFGKNMLDRSDLARVNDALSELGVEAVAYDVIFARQGIPDSDRQFESSISRVGSVYLPIGLDFTDNARPFRWRKGPSYDRFRSDYLRRPVEKGKPGPMYATRALMQYDIFSEAAFNSGHISAYDDPDGVYRHILMLLKVDDHYFPTLTLSMFLDYARVSLDEITVEWGRRIIIPATKDGPLERDVIVPIDERGRAFIPYTRTWARDFKKMPAHDLLKYMEDENLRGNLTDFFEGRFIFIGDISVGSSDLGQTPLESEAPLIIMHTSMMNAFLTNTFYKKWPLASVMGLMILVLVLLGLSALPKRSWVLYGVGGCMIIGLLWLTWFEFIHFRLFPLATAGGSTLSILFGLIIGIEIAVTKEQAFIRNAFSKYVPERVVSELLIRPERLRLGGEERIITVLFSDVAGFTSISENMSPSELVNFLNEYLTEMTNIVLEEGGIIDKYEGDAIMAEFGAPLEAPDHADMAVRAGLKMQGRLKALRPIWKEKGLPELRCRVGINTGPMIIGNMGSNQVFDYTVMGDAVNLASRLEGANKRYNTNLMISESTYEQINSDQFKTRTLDVIKVKGKSRAVKVFEVYGDADDATPPEDELYYRTYHQAFEAYLSRDFSSARDRFLKALGIRPEDPASSAMIERIDAIDPDGLPADWDGSIALTQK